ncbi:MAG: hypothetical protein AAB257_06140 [Nitrospinota bacterium]
MKRPSIKKLKGRTTKDIFVSLTEPIKKKLQTKGIKEEEILEDFERHRKPSRKH